MFAVALLVQEITQILPSNKSKMRENHAYTV